MPLNESKLFVISYRPATPLRVVHSDILPVSSVSEHDAAYAKINARVIRYAPRFKYIRNEKQFHDHAFKEDITNLPFDVIYGIESTDDLLGILNSLINEC